MNDSSRKIEPSGRSFLPDAAGLALWALLSAAVFCASQWMVSHDWEHGRGRSALIAGCALIAFAIRWPWAPSRIFASRSLAGLATLAALVALVADVRIGLESASHARMTGEIRLDQGQNLLRATQLLARGEDPYGSGALIDLEAYNQRLRIRVPLGMPPHLHPVALPQALARYGRDPERSLAQQLLPAPPPAADPEQAALAAREYALLGHKYGPLPVLTALPFVYFEHQLGLGPQVIPWLQLFAFLGWIAALTWLLLTPALGLGTAAIPLVLLLVLVEPQVAHNYLYDSASDAWVLGFCTLALAAWLREKSWLTGLAVALALGCKIFPAALFLPLIFTRPMRSALLSFVLASALLYLPFLLWDPRGLWLNLVAWPSLMEPDNTGWIFYFANLSPLIRPLVLLAIAALSFLDLFWRRGDGSRAPAHFALASALAILAGSAFHNNYIPWVTSWAFVALAITFASARPPSPERQTDG
jgi:hypothetical protein